MTEYDSQHGNDRHRQHHADNAPQQSPKSQCKKDGDWMQFQASPHQFRRHQVTDQHVYCARHGDDGQNHPGVLELRDRDRHRQQSGDNWSYVRNISQEENQQCKELRHSEPQYPQHNSHEQARHGGEYRHRRDVAADCGFDFRVNVRPPMFRIPPQ
jgi:hypothetical protein